MATIEPRTIADSVRANVQGSTALLSEWLALFRRGAPHYYNLRLGATKQVAFGVPLDFDIEGMLRRFNRYSDAVVITPDAIEVIEAKPVADASAISQVKLYSRLVPATPDLQQFLPRAVKPIVLFGTFDELVNEEAIQAGVEAITYSPAWINNYLSERYFRSRRSRKVQA